MASSNDRKISQLPLKATIADDTNFLIVSDISTTPKNERINTGILFTEIPVQVSVGSPLNGRNVIFNSTASSTNRFYFEGLTGDVSLGHNLNVANDVDITGDLNVTGTATLTNPLLLNLDLPGNLNANGAVTFQNTTSVTGQTTLNDVTVLGDSSFSGLVNISGASTFTANTNHTNINASYANILNSDLTNVTASKIDTTDLNVVNDLLLSGNIVANGYIRAIGNVFGNVGNFNELYLSANGFVNNTLTSNNIVVTNNLSTPAFTTVNFNTQNITVSANLDSDDIQSNTANITSITSSLLNSTDAIIANTLTTLNLDAYKVTADFVDSDVLTSLNATITHTINSTNTISKVVSTEEVLFSKIYTVRPSYSLYPLGTIIIHDDGVQSNLLIATSSGWREVALT